MCVSISINRDGVMLNVNLKLFVMPQGKNVFVMVQGLYAHQWVIKHSAQIEELMILDAIPSQLCA